MAVSITVSELKCAALDPAWRDRWCQGAKVSTKPRTPQGEIVAYGALFHRIVDRFVGWLCSDSSNDLSKTFSVSSNALWQELHDRFVAVDLSQLSRRGRVEEAHRLTGCLKCFCQHLVDLRDRTRSFKTWQDVFLGQEFDLKNVEFRTESDSVFVSGRVDAVRTHPEFGIEVVDYKLSRGVQAKHDLVQLAIYSCMLTHVKPHLNFHGVIEYYEPGLHELAVAVGQLSSIFDEIVVPALSELADCRAGSRKKAPANQMPSAKRSGPRIYSTDSSDDPIAKKIRGCYAAFKLGVTIIDKTVAPQLIRYRVRPEPGVKVVSLANRAEDLQVGMGLAQPPLISAAQGSVIIDIPKAVSDTVRWRAVMDDPSYKANPSPVAFPIGLGVDGQLLVADFADPNCCHALVAGTSGSGKSEFLKSLVAALITRNSPSILKITLIDPKILTFGSLRVCSNLTGPVVTDASSAIDCLEEAATEMDERYRRLADEGFENLGQRFVKGRTDIPFRVIVFDEFADLIAAGKEVKQRFESIVARLAAKARAAGIHLVLTTQRPDRKVITGLIKSNLPLKICLRVNTTVDSQIILDDIGGESLLGRGDLLCNRGRGPERAQSPYISQDELVEIVTEQR